MNAQFRMFGFLILIAMLASACAAQPAAAPVQPAAALQATQPPVTQAPPAATEAPAATAAPALAATPGTLVNLGKNETLGTFLVDENGMTLYLFTKDVPDTSNCYDACAEKWPPLLTTGAPAAGAGVDGALLGVTERKDGAQQVTYNGWPLYYWWEDMKAGDTLGQDVGGVWYVLSPAGEMIKTAAAAPQAAATEAAAAPAAAAPAAVSSTSGETEIELEDHDKLGPILVDANGMTLYLFTNDTPNNSACYDKCAVNWPPLLVSGELKAGDGVESSLLGTTRRTDGAMQVTYNGWPLYYYIKDLQPGDAFGQEVGDVWFVISPAGALVKSPTY